MGPCCYDTHTDVIKSKQFAWTFVKEFTGRQQIPHTKSSDA